jgi:ubiquinone/menaquinone biosynthesis C-methylase UbiE
MTRPYPQPQRRGFCRWLFARMHARGYPGRYERFIEPHKRRLLGALAGTVLEIGPGNGANLRFFHSGVRWIGLEPNVHMLRYLKEEASRLGINAEIRAGLAERIDLPDASVDAVVSTMVLCSVDDVARTLAQIQRVLRPGGRFVFIEHIAAPRGTPLRRIQRMIRPIWRCVGDNCHPDRETDRAIEAAGFAQLDYQRVVAPLPLASIQIIGKAQR